MSIQPVNDSQAWAQFLSAAQAARARNPVFEAPQAQQRVEPGRTAAAGHARDVVAAHPGTSRAAAAGNVLGTRFDAYA